MTSNPPTPEHPVVELAEDDPRPDIARSFGQRHLGEQRVQDRRLAASVRAGQRDALPPVLDLFVETGLAKSKGEARRTVGEGGAYLNNERVEDPDYVPGDADLIEDRLLVLRRGKKNFAGVEVR